jgi:hypothetical protein
LIAIVAADAGDASVQANSNATSVRERLDEQV